MTAQHAQLSCWKDYNQQARKEVCIDDVIRAVRPRVSRSLDVHVVSDGLSSRLYGGVPMAQLSRRLAILCFVCITLANLAFIPTALAAPAPTADLVITNLTISPTSPVQGVDATISITVRNQGTGKAYGFVVQWKSAQFALSGPTATVSSLNAGQSTTVTFQYAFPNEGNYTTVATVDSANQVDETNETNNVAIKDATVRATAPDLYVTSFSVSPANPVQRPCCHDQCWYHQQRHRPSRGIYCAVEVGPQYSNRPVTAGNPGLAAGATKFLSFQYSFPQVR